MPTASRSILCRWILVVLPALAVAAMPGSAPVVTAAAAPAQVAFGKSGPTNGAAGVSNTLMLTWGAATGAASYEYCVDRTNDNTCDGSWTSAGAGTSASVSLFTGVTYFWQVRALDAGGATEADSGTWWSFTTRFVPLDFDRDGHADLVWRNPSTGANAVWQMNDTSLLSVGPLPDMPPADWRLVATGDVNGDGAPDIVWRNPVTGADLLWLMTGVSIGATVTLPAVPDQDWTIFAAADANNDGRADIFWRNTFTGRIAIWYMSETGGYSNNAGQTLPATVNADRNWTPAAVADMFHDTTPEILQRNERTGENRLVALDGTVTALPSVPDANWTIGSVLDLDGDNRPDIVWRHQATGANVVWHMNDITLVTNVPIADYQLGSWSVSDTSWRLAGQPRRRQMAEMNGDGAPDLVWRNQSTGDDVIWFMEGTSVTRSLALPEVRDVAWWMVGKADFTGDTLTDLVWRNTQTGENVLWRMTGHTSFITMPLPGVADLNWTLACVGDLDGDSNPDLVWRNSVTGFNVVWFMNGTTVSSTAPLPTVADLSWSLTAAADINHDGTSDLLWRNSATGGLVVWYMNGAAQIGSDGLPTMADSTWQLALVTDVDANGSADFFWRNTSTGQIVLWYMRDRSVLGAPVAFGTVADTNWTIVR